jgi:DNA topoisomerase III
MKIYLCEKPSQAKDIAPHAGARNRGDGCITGDGVAVTWCIGHLLEQAKPEHYQPALKSWALDLLPVMPVQWQLEVKDSVKSQYKVVSQLLRKATEVVIATDADREGEVIAREVLALVGYRGPISRLWLSAFDAASIKKGLAKMKPEAETRNLYFSGLGRSRADWLTGMNVTMALTTAFGAGGRGGVLHCGRVQTPVLGLIVRRERAILNFVPKTHFVLDAKFEIQGTVVPMDWVPAAGVLDGQGHCLQADVVQAVASKISRKSGRVSSVQSTPEKEPPPLPYYLGSLQKEASRRFGLKVQAVLDACQALYEKHKATTYPRTDCEYLPLSMHSEVPGVLAALSQVDPNLKPLVGLANVTTPGRCFNDSKMTAHHAIIPTANTNVRISDMTKTEQIVYELIRRRFIAQFLGDHLFTKTILTVKCEDENFSKTGKVTTTPGWKRAELAEVNDKFKPPAGEGGVVLLPSCEVGYQANNVKAECLAKKTEPPKRYTEGTLVAAMESIDKEIDDPRFKQVMKSKEKAGIGTDATRPAVIEGLFKRDYIVTDKKFIVPSDKGKQLIELLEKIAPQLVDPVLTAHWEERLAQVETGQAQLVQFEGEIKSWLATVIDSIKAKAGTVRIGAPATSTNPGTGATRTTKTGPKCAGCSKGTLRLINGAKGPFWGCSEYQAGCKATFPDVEGMPQLVKPGMSTSASEIKTAATQQSNTNLAGTACESCHKGKLQLRNLPNADRQFWGCTGFPACRHFVWAK